MTDLPLDGDHRVPRGTAMIRLDLSGQVYDAIRAKIMNRQVVGGEKISLQTLADEFDVSRSPVQHALTRLVTEGLVVSERRGYLVKALTPEDIDDAYDARLALEIFAAERTVGRLPDSDLKRLEALVEAVRRQGRGHGALELRVAAKRDFHDLQIDLADNVMVSRFYRQLGLPDLGRRTLPLVGPGITKEWYAELSEIVTGYRASDLRAVRKALAVHVENGKRRMREAADMAGGSL